MLRLTVLLEKFWIRIFKSKVSSMFKKHGKTTTLGVATPPKPQQDEKKAESEPKSNSDQDKTKQ